MASRPEVKRPASSFAEIDNNGARPAALIAVTILMALLSIAVLDARSALAAQSISRGDSRGDAQTKITIHGGDLQANITLSSARVISGKQIGVTVAFDVAPGWHIYGKPLPEEYTPTTISFDNELLSEQNLNFPKPTMVRFELLGDTFPVYQGRFQAFGTIRVRQKLAPGEHRLGGTLSFQECNDNLCKMPQQVRFEIPLWIDSPMGRSG